MFKNLFGKPKQATSDEKSQPVGDLLGFPNLFIQIEDPILASSVEDWRWLGLDGLTAIGATAFVDIVLRDGGGTIVLIDMLEGQLMEIAPSLEALANKLASPDARDELLFEGLVMSARNRGMMLGLHECYDFTVPPVLGGEVSIQSVEVTAFVVKSGILAQIHEQIKDLPPGTPIGEVRIED